MNFIKVASDNWNFEEEGTKKRFIPMGTNYYDPESGWTPKLWQRYDHKKVNKHFLIMKEIGINVVRVFLTTKSFINKRDKLNKESLQKLDDMIDTGKRNNIRFILVGPSDWEGEPEWESSNSWTSDESLKVLEFFWKEITKRYFSESAIFAWDIFNEPSVPWKSSMLQYIKCIKKKYKNLDTISQPGQDLWGEWGDLHKEDCLGDNVPTLEEEMIGERRLYDSELLREKIGLNWIKRQVKAIKKNDSNHMVTVGLTQNVFPGYIYHTGFNLKQIVHLLDFISVHFYPYENLFQSMDSFEKYLNILEGVVRYAYRNKPVVLEEFGWYGGGETLSWSGRIFSKRTEREQAEWCVNAVKKTIDCASGWISWPYADTPSSTDISKYAGLVTGEGNLKDWGYEFKRLIKEMKSMPLKRKIGRALMKVKLKDCYSSPKNCIIFFRDYLKLKKKFEKIDFEIM